MRLRLCLGRGLDVGSRIGLLESVFLGVFVIKAAGFEIQIRKLADTFGST